MGWPQFIEATDSLDCPDPESPSITASSYASPQETNKKNYTKIIDFNNGFDNKTELESAFNLTNALESNDVIKNEDLLSLNLTNQTGFGVDLDNLKNPGSSSSSPEIIADFNGDGLEDQASGVAGFNVARGPGAGAVI